MKIFSVTGLTGSGKTTVIEAIIRELKSRGFSVGTVKNIHAESFKMDTEGKNTWRHRNAGADTVVAHAHYETDILYNYRLPLHTLLKHFTEDFVILEGMGEASVENIAVCKEGETPQIGDLTVAVSGRFANSGVKEFKGLPVFNLSDIKALTDLIINKVSFVPAKDLIHGGNVEVKVNGEVLTLVPFVQNILKNAVLGVIKELRGYNEGAEVEVILK
ncbi:MAG: molybdopterin-guanine dinucleotide biosynthesis protein B [Firmicutes bacterium]|nr:molybdopterin-guanine dinucleotide biosynthesis protein B [Bacillota bacterium]